MKIFCQITVFVILSLSAANGYTTCDIQSCDAEVTNLLSSPSDMCQNDAPIQQAMLRCIRREDKTKCPDSVRAQVPAMAQRVQDNFQQFCAPRAAEAREGGQCELIEMVSCLAEFATVLAAPNLFPLSDMSKFCRDLAQISAALGKCANCVAGWIGNWEDIKNDVERITQVSLVLINGGCTCAQNITVQVGQIDNSSTCSFVEDVSKIAKTIASDCIVPAINQVESFDWLTMTDRMISSVLNVGQTICVFFNAGPVTVASSSLVILIGLLASAVFSFKLNRFI